MTRIAQFFMRRPTLFWSLMVGILILGVLSFSRMPKLEDPAVDVKQATVVVPYPGADAYQVELDVAQVMEDELRTLPDIRKIKTECKDGMAMFTVEFQMTVLLEDLEQHFDLLRRKTNDVASKLPQGCYAPIVIDDMMDVYGVFFGLTADGYDYPEMYKYAKYIRRELLDVKGVKRINIVGNRDEVINIVLSKEQIARNGIIPTEIMSTLQGDSKTVSAGKLQTGEDRLSIEVDSSIKDEDDIADMMIKSVNGKRVRLGDIAKIERTYKEPQTNGFFVNGKPAIAICIAMEKSAVVPDVGKAIDQKLEQVMKNVPVGFATEKIFFQPDKVSAAVSSFMWNLVESVLIVIILLIFTMGFRSGVIIGFGLVLTVAVSFPILLTLGTTLQRISLGAFIVAMGMLVDNAVVIMDGILVDKQRGLPRDTYLWRIGKNTAMPLLGATIIAASTFLSCYLSPDSAGEYAHDLFLVLCISLLASWVFALVQVPICADLWLPKTVKAPSDGKAKKPMNSPMHRAIRRIVATVIRFKAVSFTLAVVILIICLMGAGKIKNLFFSDFDYKQFIVECYFPPQTNPDEVRDRMLAMSDTLLQNKDIERVAMSMGSAPAHYCLVRPMTNGGDCYGELMVDCADYNTVMAVMPEVRRKLREENPDAYIRLRKYNFSISTSHTVEVEFTGPDPAVLRQLSAKAEDIMRQCPYVDPYSVENNWKPMGKSMVVNYSEADARRAGISRGDIGNALSAAGDGMTIGVLADQDNMVMINLQMRNADGSRIEDLGDIPVWSTLNVNLNPDDMKGLITGATSVDQLSENMSRSTTLSSVSAKVTLNPAEQVIHRYNGRRAIEAECDPNPDLDAATPAKCVAEITDAIEAIPLPDGYSMRWVGDGETSGEAIGNLMVFVPLIIFIILLVLLMLFNSWRKLIIVLLCLPFAFVGITPSLLLTNTPFTFMAVLGMMGLVGMLIKNAIVLIDEITRLTDQEHIDPYRAIIDATTSRVRPVLMASLTTIAGMLPLVSDPMYGSLSVIIMGGLTMGTLITLVLVPLFYATFFRIKKSADNNEN
jgi:multidrug efflux pump subunit AcrB